MPKASKSAVVVSESSEVVPVPVKVVKEPKVKAPKVVSSEAKESVPVPVVSETKVEEVKVSKKSKAPKKSEVVVSESKESVLGELVSEVLPEVVLDKSTVLSSETVSTSSIARKVKIFCGLGAEIARDIRTLDKNHLRELKVAEKAGQKKKRKNSNYTPSGFLKPATISDEMADFLGKEHGSQIARKDVTNEINAYIKLHNLQYKENRKIILADDKLRTLLKIPQEVLDVHGFTYFQLQKYLKIHFPKQALSVPVVV